MYLLGILILYLIHYFTLGHFLQDFLLNFGVFSVLYKDYASILLLFTMLFVLVAKQPDFPPASFASKRKLCYNRDKKQHIYTGKDRNSHGTKRWLQHPHPAAHLRLPHQQPPACGKRLQHSGASGGTGRKPQPHHRVPLSG